MAREYLRLGFTFTDDDDVKAYGAGPHIYDEYRIVAMDARALVEIENMIGMPVAIMMNSVRASSAIGDMAGTWVALHLAGHPDLPAYPEYNPHTLLIEWSAPPEADPGKVEVPDTTSGTSEVISLPTLPVAG